MRWRDYFLKQIAEVWGFDIIMFFLGVLVTVVITMLGKDPLLPAVFTAYFCGMFASRMIYAEKPEIGLEAVSEEELAAMREQRRGHNE